MITHRTIPRRPHISEDYPGSDAIRRAVETRTHQCCDQRIFCIMHVLVDKYVTHVFCIKSLWQQNENVKTRSNNVLQVEYVKLCLYCEQCNDVKLKSTIRIFLLINLELFVVEYRLSVN